MGHVLEAEKFGGGYGVYNADDPLNCSRMFANDSVTSITVSNKVTDCSYMFANSNELPTNFVIPNAPINCYRMFYGCNSLNISTINVPGNLANCESMFGNITASTIKYASNFQRMTSNSNYSGLYRDINVSLSGGSYYINDVINCNASNLFYNTNMNGAVYINNSNGNFSGLLGKGLAYYTKIINSIGDFSRMYQNTDSTRYGSIYSQIVNTSGNFAYYLENALKSNSYTNVNECPSIRVIFERSSGDISGFFKGLQWDNYNYSSGYTTYHINCLNISMTGLTATNISHLFENTSLPTYAINNQMTNIRMPNCQLVEDYSYAYYNSYLPFSTYAGINCFVKVSPNAVNLAYAFYLCRNDYFNNCFDKPSVNTYNIPAPVVNMAYAFYGGGGDKLSVASVMNLNFLGNNVKDMSGLWSNLSITSYASTYNIPNSVENCSYLFYNTINCAMTNKLPDSVTNCAYMYCGSYPNLTGMSGHNDNHIYIPPNAVNCSHMYAYQYFANIANQKIVNIPDTVEDCSGMFGLYAEAPQLVSINNIPSSCINASNMFYSTGGTSYPTINIKKTTLYLPNTIVDASYMFHHVQLAPYTANVYIPSNVQNCEYMFYTNNQLPSNIYINQTTYSRDNMINFNSRNSRSPQCNIRLQNMEDYTNTVLYRGSYITWSKSTKYMYNSTYNIFIYNNYTG